ncbi:hypothetical protein Tco_1211395 [Tanacetum coccineum]
MEGEHTIITLSPAVADSRIKHLYDSIESIDDRNGIFSSTVCNLTSGCLLEQFQVNTKFLNTLPDEWSKFVTDVKLVKDLHTTNVDQLHAHLQQHERHANDYIRRRLQDLKRKQNVENSFPGSNEQFAEIVRLKQNLFEQVQEKDCLMKIVSELKNELKLEENRNIEREIDLEKKIKQLDNIIFKRGQSALRLSKKEPLPQLSLRARGELADVQKVFYQMEQAVEQHRLESRTFEVKMNQVLSENERLLAQAIDKDIVKTVVNLSVNANGEPVTECQKCLELETELIKKKDFVDKETYDKLCNRSENIKKAQSQANDTVIVKLKEKISPLTGNVEDSSAKNLHRNFASDFRM